MKTDLEVSTLVICELAQVTRDGKISLLGVFSRLTTESMPLSIPRFFMVGMIKGVPLSEHRVSFRMVSPLARNSIQQYQAQLRLGFDGRANVINELTNTTLTEYGDYAVMMYVDGIRMAETELVVEAPQTLNLRKSSSTIPN